MLIDLLCRRKIAYERIRNPPKKLFRENLQKSHCHFSLSFRRERRYLFSKICQLLLLHNNRPPTTSEYSRDLQSTGWPFMATIRSRSSVSGEAFLGHYPVEIFSHQGGLSWPLSSRGLQSPGRPFLATIQSRSSVTGEAFLGHYPVEIFCQRGGFSWPLSSRDLQPGACYWDQSTLFLGQSDLQEVI